MVFKITYTYLWDKLGRILWRTGNMYIIALLYIFLGYLFTSLNYLIPIPYVDEINKKYSKNTANLIIFLLMMVEIFLTIIIVYFTRNIIKYIVKKGLILPIEWISKPEKMSRLLQNEFGGSIFAAYLLLLFSERLNEKIAYFANIFGIINTTR